MDQRILIISPVRNEAAHFERVARAVAAQGQPPTRWIVVDDGSDDGTLELAEGLADEIPFMTVISAPPATVPSARDRLAQAAAPRTFNFVLGLDDPQNYDFIGKLDGDIELPPDYFAQLCERFRRDPEIGIACGDLVEDHHGQWRRIPIPPHHVHGAVKFYSRECFKQIGGVQTRLGWDTIDETYARLHGYRTRSFRDIVARHHRAWGSADGVLRGRARHGRCAYIVHYPFPWVALRSLKLAGARPYGLSGAAFLWGWLHARADRTQRVDDPDFRRQVRRELSNRIRAKAGQPKSSVKSEVRLRSSRCSPEATEGADTR